MCLGVGLVARFAQRGRGLQGRSEDPRGSRLFNNSEIRSRIVIPDKASQVGNHGEVLSVDNNAGTDRRLLERAGGDRLKMRLGYMARAKRVIGKRYQPNVNVRCCTLGYMVKRLSASGGCLGS